MIKVGESYLYRDGTPYRIEIRNIVEENITIGELNFGLDDFVYYSMRRTDKNCIEFDKDRLEIVNKFIEDYCYLEVNGEEEEII
jgi:hypothetical protein